MNEEEKQALIHFAKELIIGSRSDTVAKIAEIALAAMTAQPVKLPTLELVATLKLKDSQYEWDRICYIPDGEHDLYIIKEVQE